MLSEIISLQILTHARGLGTLRLRKLIEEFGSPSHLVEAGWNEKANLLFNKWPVGSWQENYESAEKEGVSIISYRDSTFPHQFLKLSDCPLLLYVKGVLPTQKTPSVAVIGTRNATLYGMEQAQRMGSELSQAGVCVVSGLARGIDTAAHLGALKGGGQTVAIIGSGLGHIYPGENRGLAEKIAASGAIVSEYPMKTLPFKGAFPKRNRLVSALSDAICLIESPQEGGGMITMKLGEEQKKILCALPGRVDWPSFEGNHFLLKNKKATLVENSSDLLKDLNIIKKTENTPKKVCCNPEEEALLQKLPHEEKSIEELVLLTQLPIMQLNVLLTRLVLKKLVKEFPGKIYKKVSF